MEQDLKVNTKDFIFIKGARLNNLKNIDVLIPRKKLVVITGLSGSGKSTLAFDTLFAEGQRRYVESLSSYARQFLGRMNKPEVDYIKGISPAIAIQQKVSTRNPRSTVGTSTEIYDYLKLLFARAGITISPKTGKEVKRDTPQSVFESLKNDYSKGDLLFILAPFEFAKGEKEKTILNLLSQQGYSRLFNQGKIEKIDDLLALKKPVIKDPMLVIDRIVFAPEDPDQETRVLDSLQTAFFEGHGKCIIATENKRGKISTREFSNKFEEEGLNFEEPDVNFFSFNNPVGACKTCEGFGSIIGIDENLVIPDPGISLYEDAVACWKGEVMSEWKNRFIRNAHKIKFPVHTPYEKLKKEEKDLLWEGKGEIKGIKAFFKMLESNSYKIQYRVMLSRYRGKTTCPECLGTRLRKDAAWVKVGGKSLHELLLMSITDLADFFKKIKLTRYQEEVSARILTEIQNRLKYLVDVGLPYLTLNRLSSSLSGGESQRINLATSLGSSLVGSMYILDEPSIGLHPRDTGKLISILKKLRDLGNTVIVVEHEEEVMKAADEIIDIGPGSGSFGGELVFQGSLDEMIKKGNCLTADYLAGRKEISVPAKRRNWKEFIEIKGAQENNLKKLDVKFPLGILTVVTGVSGSGKSSLVKKILFPALKKKLGGYSDYPGKFSGLSGNLNALQAVEFVDQNPIGKSTRSNPVTYVKAYDEIRNLFASLPLSQQRGYKPSHFSFNVDGGRCDVCQGEGEVTIEMQFMADIHLPCEACSGKRFKSDILEVQAGPHNISDILNLTIDDAIRFFREGGHGADHLFSKIADKLQALQDVGLGYIKLGQSSSTLSGGEAQRVKLASFIGMGNTGLKTLFIFDEPTTGLHFHDIHKLLGAFESLLNLGHSIVIIEHNPEVIKTADWVIDLGPEGGDEGGHIIYQGVPEGLPKVAESYTGKYLKEKLK